MEEAARFGELTPKKLRPAGRQERQIIRRGSTRRGADQNSSKSDRRLLCFVQQMLGNVGVLNHSELEPNYLLAKRD
jgi:hypothetical protein